ncbi:antibiotic biosynthesis monooxygenase [Paenibacillus sp. TRM 82003]|nr:antibiotic biosynthesis monooxygenase [Paenibacillus sp. TRM 82003]
MSKHSVLGKLSSIPGERDALAAILLEAASAMSQADGCELYLVHLAEDDPDAIWVTELWRDAAAHQASLGLEATRALIGRARPLIAGMEPIRIRPLGGLGM